MQSTEHIPFMPVEEETKGRPSSQIEDGEKDFRNVNIGANDSIMFNEALIRDEEDELKRIFVGNPKNF